MFASAKVGFAVTWLDKVWGAEGGAAYLNARRDNAKAYLYSIEYSGGITTKKSLQKP